MKRIFIIFLFCILQLQVISSNSCAGDSTSFNPVPIQVTAKSAGGGVPVGTIIAWPVSRNPSDMENWLECNGQYVNASVYPELAAVVGGRVPDFRGLFLRGVGGNSAGLGQAQGDAIRNIVGEVGMTGVQFNYGTGATVPVGYSRGPVGSYGDHAGGFNFDASRQVPTANENRPQNMAVRYFIRAAM